MNTAHHTTLKNRSVFTETEFESLYTALRRKEGRMYADEELISLPEIDASHPYYREWQIRKRSAEKLFNYLSEKNKPLKILEAGCGNGWLSAMLSGIPDADVTGTDINALELLQAEQVFGNKPNLRFVQEDLRSNYFNQFQFDIIVFAASLQYFFSAPEILRRALSLLRHGGEVHIMDSFFYKETELEPARWRTALHFESMGFPEMVRFYFHHSLGSLKEFNYDFLSRPGSFYRLFSGNTKRFPWIRIRHT